MKNVSQRVLMLVGGGDWLIPSEAEGKRLEKILPRCNVKASYRHCQSSEASPRHAMRCNHCWRLQSPVGGLWQLRSECGCSSSQEIVLAIYQCAGMLVLVFCRIQGVGT